MAKFLDAVKNINADIRPEQAADAIIRETCNLLHCDRATLYFCDAEANELILVIASGAKNIRLPIGTGIAGFVADKGTTLNIPDAYQDSRFSPAFDQRTGYKTDSILCVPVWDTSGEMVAVLQCINKLSGTPFSRSDELILEHMASHVGVVLRNAKLFESERNAHTKVSSLLDIVKSLHNGAVSTHSLIFSLSNKSHELVDADRCTLYMVDRSRKIPQLVVMQGDVDIRFPLTKGIAGSVATSGAALLIPDAYKDHRFSREVDLKTGYRTKSILTMPIWGSQRRQVVGVLQVINKLDETEFTRADKELLETLLDVAGPILEQSQMAQKKINPNTGEEMVKPTYGRQRRGSGTVKAGLLGNMRQGNKGIKPMPKRRGGLGMAGGGGPRAGGFQPSLGAPSFSAPAFDPMSAPPITSTRPSMGAFAEEEDEDY
jgi:adenylate cyclase